MQYAGLLTERQAEVREAQRRGAVRHGVSTGTLADASQSAWSQGVGRLPAVTRAAAATEPPPAGPCSEQAEASAAGDGTHAPRQPGTLHADHLAADEAEAASPTGAGAVHDAAEMTGGATAVAAHDGVGRDDDLPAAEDAVTSDRHRCAAVADRDRVSASPETPRDGRRPVLAEAHALPAGPAETHLCAATERRADSAGVVAPGSSGIPATGARCAYTVHAPSFTCALDRLFAQKR